MGRYLLRRLVQAPVVLLVLATVSFFLMRAAPGGPFDRERKAAPEIEQALAARYHLDEPLGLQYLREMGNLARGDLGPSYIRQHESVNEIIGRHLPPSLVLGAAALLIALVSGLAAGVIAAMRHGRLADHASMSVAMLGLSVPPFVVGPLLALVFGLVLGWLPTAGYAGPLGASYLVLPALTLALPFASRIARLMRAGMLEVVHQDYIRTARAKGLGETAVILRHALRGGMLPVVSYLGPAVAYLLTGSLVVEQVFQVPGLGTEFVQAANNRDYTLVMGTVLVYGAILIAANLASDLLYGLLDPRVRYR